MRRLKKVEPANGKLLLTYENGEHRLFDVHPYMKGSYMGELKNPAYFAMVRVHPILGDTVMWPHEQDISPHELYELSVPCDKGFHENVEYRRRQA